MDKEMKALLIEMRQRLMDDIKEEAMFSLTGKTTDYVQRLFDAEQRIFLKLINNEDKA